MVWYGIVSYGMVWYVCIMRHCFYYEIYNDFNVKVPTKLPVARVSTRGLHPGRPVSVDPSRKVCESSPATRLAWTIWVWVKNVVGLNRRCW